MKKHDFYHAQHPHKKGETVLNLGHESTNAANHARLQIDESTYILPPFPIRHSCMPNAYIDWKHNLLIAAKSISKEEMVTYHYGTSEDDYTIGKFDCNCGSRNCLGHFRGFKFMTTAQRASIKQYVSPFLRHKYYAF